MKNSLPTPRRILIAGGGLAGQRCAETLRRSGYDGVIRIICAESRPPYDRPPLSKEMLSGNRTAADLAFRAEGWYAQHDVELVLGETAASLDTAQRRVGLAGGGHEPYDRLLIATGGRPRMLTPFAGYENAGVLRSLDDAQRLAAALAGSDRLVVIGAGFIGQEVAACARGLGREVTMIEAAPQPLIGILGPELGRWFADLHRAEGVDVITGQTVRHVTANGRIRELTLSDGTRVGADHVLVGVGVAPELQWLADSGLLQEGRLVVDGLGTTAAADVFAAGDVATAPSPDTGRLVTGAHWESAARQGAQAARAMLGLAPGAAPVTGFWSDQYGLRIQYVGDAAGADRVTIDGDPESRDFTATFSRDERTIAVLLVNRPRQLPAARTLIRKGAPS